MGIFNAFVDSVGGTFADQWKDIITPARMSELDLVVPGHRRNNMEGRGDNHGLSNVITNGSIIEVPENTAAFIFSRQGIENVIGSPGGYAYENGQPTVLDSQARAEQGVSKILLNEMARRIEFSGMSPDDKRVSYVNLRELRGIKFGTRGPMAYNDLYYETDLEIHAYGTFCVKVTNPVLLIRNFATANANNCSLANQATRSQLVAELLSSFLCALNSMSAECRISQLPSRTNVIKNLMLGESENAGTWPERFGLELTSIAIEGIEFSDESRELVRRYSEKKMDVRAYEGISQQAADIAAQQKIAEGIRDTGLGDGGGMVFGMNLANGLNTRNASQAAAPAPAPQPAAPSLNEQIEQLRKLKDLLDEGILSQEEFNAAKQRLLGI